MEQFPQPNRKDGGEPCSECRLQPGETFDICGAVKMSLRDWFAGQALMAAMDTRETGLAARRCYEMADALLLERMRVHTA